MSDVIARPSHLDTAKELVFDWMAAAQTDRDLHDRYLLVDTAIRSRLIDQTVEIMPIEESRPSLDHYLELLHWAQQRPRVSEEVFWQKVKDEADFTLWFGAPDESRYKLTSWIPELSDLVDERIGADNKVAIGRTLYGFGKIDPQIIDYMTASGRADYVYDGQHQGIVVRDAGYFFDEFLNLTGMGPATAAGVLCISALQAEKLGY